MLRLGLTLFLYILVFSNIQCTRILAMFPTPSISHQVTFRPLCHELAKRGHEVIVITPDPAFPKNDTPPNLREIDVHDISYSIWKKHWTSKIDVGKTDYLYDQIEQALKVLSIIFQRQIEVEEVQKLIQDKNKFDLILLEGVVTPTIGLSHVFKAPVIFMYSYGVEQHSNYITGSPAHPLVFFDMLVTKQTNLSNWDKIREVYNYWQFSKLYQARNIEDDEMLRKLFDPKIPPLSELYNNIDLYFFNIHPIWDTNRPTPPNVIHLGGIHQNEKKELPKCCVLYDITSVYVIYKLRELCTDFSNVSYSVNKSPNCFRPLCHELAKRGHEVIVITTDPAFPKNESLPNLREIDLHDMSYSLWRNYWLSKVNVGKTNNFYDQMETALKILSAIVEHQLQTEEVREIIHNKNKNIDLLLLEAPMKSTLALSHIFKAPVICLSSLGPTWDSNYVIGAQIHPILFPEMTTSIKQNKLSYWDKIHEIYIYWRISKLVEVQEIEDDKMLKRVIDSDIPPLSVLKNNIDMLFLNIRPIWDTNRPVPPNVIYIGGIHINEQNVLPQDLEAYLNSSQHGVIYFSFGTNTIPSKLQSTTIQTFIKVFSKLPYDVLWKWDADELPGRTENIRIFKWLPQSDLLRHPKVKLFITQGGLQSTDEAIVAGVPLIGIPMLGDQWFNVEKYVQHKIGVRLDFDKITEDLLKNAIETVIGDKSFRNNIIKLRSIMNDQPQTPLERAVWWTEYLLRHGGTKHLRSPSANMPWRQYYEIDLIMIIVASLIISISAIAVILLFIFKLVSKLFVKPAKSKKL